MQRLAPGVVRVELRNGHRLVARLLRRHQDRAAELVVGRLVTVEVSPSDLSKGLIVVEQA